MKNRIMKTLILIFSSVSSFSLAQFNTLLPTKPQKMENIKILEAPKEEGSNQKKDKKSWKNIFNSTTKSELKNKLDSLKTMLKNYNETNNERRSNSEKLKDSLFELIQKFQPKENDEKEMQKAPFGGLGACISLPLRNNISITSPYGVRTHPIFGNSKMHHGIDLKAHYEGVYAVLDGIITETGWDSKGGGNFIKIKHFNRFETSYLHLSEIYYKVGEKVRAGFIIGKSGNTGNSTGPHLHFAVKEYGRTINPAHFLRDLINANHKIAINYAN